MLTFWHIATTYEQVYVYKNTSITSVWLRPKTLDVIASIKHSKPWCVICCSRFKFKFCIRWSMTDLEINSPFIDLINYEKQHRCIIVWSSLASSAGNPKSYTFCYGIIKMHNIIINWNGCGYLIFLKHFIKTYILNPFLTGNCGLHGRIYKPY